MAAAEQIDVSTGHDTSPNLYQRMLQVQRMVTHVAKDARNEQQRFDYVSSSAVLSAIREAMNAAGLVLLTEITEETLHLDAAYKGSKSPQHLTEITMQFTWVNVDNPEERMVHRWYAQGIDGGEKGVGKAATYGEKYYLVKTFHLPTDGDDPDGSASPKPAPQQQQQQSSKPATGPQNLGEFRQALTDLGIPPAQHQATCDAAAGRPVNMQNMKPAAFAMVLNAVANPEPPEDPAPAPTPAPPTADHADGAGPFSETGWTATQPPTPTQLGEWVGQFGLPAQTLQIARGLAGLPGEQHMREFDPDQCWRFYDCLRWRVQYDENGTTWRLRLDEIGDQSQEADTQ
jgi:hypothetical protein